MNPSIETTAGMDLTPRALEAPVEELRSYHALYRLLFQRREQREQADTYLQGLLLELPRKSIEPLVLALEGAKSHAVRAMQQVISEELGRHGPPASPLAGGGARPGRGRWGVDPGRFAIFPNRASNR
jgi:DDE superfamily endonuclease